MFPVVTSHILNPSRLWELIKLLRHPLVREVGRVVSRDLDDMPPGARLTHGCELAHRAVRVSDGQELRVLACNDRLSRRPKRWVHATGLVKDDQRLLAANTLERRDGDLARAFCRIRW